MAEFSGTILIVDDDDDIRMLFSFNLAKGGYEVIEAGDGQEALALLRSAPVALVITDYNMPVLDGYGLIRKMREDAALAAIPVLLLSGQEEHRLEATDFPPDGVLSKPCSAADLLSKVGEVLGQAGK